MAQYIEKSAIVTEIEKMIKQKKQPKNQKTN